MPHSKWQASLQHGAPPDLSWPGLSVCGRSGWLRCLGRINLVTKHHDDQKHKPYTFPLLQALVHREKICHWHWCLQFWNQSNLSGLLCYMCCFLAHQLSYGKVITPSITSLKQAFFPPRLTPIPGVPVYCLGSRGYPHLSFPVSMLLGLGAAILTLDTLTNGFIVQPLF